MHHFPAETNEDKYSLSPCPISPFKGAISGGKLTINRERGREKERTSVGPQKKTEKLNESLKARAIRRGCCALTNKRKRSFSVVGRRQLGAHSRLSALMRNRRSEPSVLISRLLTFQSTRYGHEISLENGCDRPGITPSAAWLAGYRGLFLNS